MVVVSCPRAAHNTLAKLIRGLEDPDSELQMCMNSLQPGTIVVSFPALNRAFLRNRAIPLQKTTDAFLAKALHANFMNCC